MTTPGAQLERLAKQKAVLLTTFRRNGQRIGTPVNIAVEGDHAYVRTFAASGKAKRMRNNPRVRIAPCTMRGTPTGPDIEGGMRALDGTEAKAAARRLNRKYPFQQRVLLEVQYALTRREAVTYEFTPDSPAEPPDSPAPPPAS
ncbi:PPOX class F420-dependent oxidoreductase [Streptomyces sp. NPDC051940]|uniref:PPOX class F420-dependent oxidoreductase n=1 Tax=Streptomyces sp. NPDC051940 TaxID=3155675 RepID=UPI0034333250